MTFEFIFQIAPDMLGVWADNIENSPLEMLKVMDESGEIVKDMKREIDAVNVYPGNVKYPIEWTSENQRRYYFAVIAEYDSEGNVIPYQRKGTFFDDVTVEFNPSLLTLSIVNPNPVARYVIGDNQQKFHKNAGWLNADDEYEPIIINAQQKIIDAWFDIIDLKGLA